MAWKGKQVGTGRRRRPVLPVQYRLYHIKAAIVLFLCGIFAVVWVVWHEMIYEAVDRACDTVRSHGCIVEQ